ncbi:MAG: cation transporter [Bacilli bacterium]|nr:cation transporter [Bacilli bacterium]
MDRFKSVRLASILGIFSNLFLLFIKSVVGFIFNSQAMIADAFNSAGDIFSSLMTFVGNKIASKPSDDDHNLGHGKAEYIYSMLISIVMILTSIIVFKDSILSLINKNKYEFSIWLVVVCGITILLKFLLFIYTDKLSMKYNNLLIKANSKDHRNDCILTMLNLISCLFSILNIYFLDALVGSFIAIWILITSIKIFIESYDILMDKSIDDLTKDRVFEIINSHKEIKKVIHFNSTPVGYRYQISFTIYVDGNLSTFESHEIADNLEKEIDKKIDEIYLTVIHVNPIEIKKD